jgi:RNA polymerase primary sigma factor
MPITSGVYIGKVNTGKRLNSVSPCPVFRPARTPVQSGLRLYLKRFANTPLLTAEQEKTLALAIRSEQNLAARELLVISNLRLVVSIAKQFLNRGVELEDLIVEGNLGLLRATDRFDPAFGTRFSTYASWWIKQAIRRSLLKGGPPVHIPSYMVELIGRCKQASRKLEGELERPPSLEELAAELALPLGKVRMIWRAVKALHTPVQAPLDDSGEVANLEDRRPDERTASPDQSTLRREELRIVRRLLDTIDEREASILRSRFGLDGQQPMTLTQVASELGISRERVRQIEEEALRNLGNQVSNDQPGRGAREARSWMSDGGPMRRSSRRAGKDPGRDRARIGRRAAAVLRSA